MKIVIIGGVAGGMSAATRMRRLDADAEIVVIEKSGHVSYANCGLPYYVGGVIEEEEALLLQTPSSLYARFRLDVRIASEVTAIDPAKKTVQVLNELTGDSYELNYDKLVLSPGASLSFLPSQESNVLSRFVQLKMLRRFSLALNRNRPQLSLSAVGLLGLKLPKI